MAKEKKIQIIKAAEKRFARHGLHKTTLNEIARDLRIGKASIYHYFESKDELYYASLEYEVSLLIEDVKNIFSSVDSRIEDSLSSYLLSKENVPLKFPMIYETLLFLVKDSEFENETALFKSLLKKEEEVVRDSFQSGLKGKILPVNPKLPGLIVNASWGMLFTGKLNQLTEKATGDSSAALIKKGIERLLYD
ncbi:MAG: TetR/AcrR family transcriptional regulator [Ignavibacteriales bacterium]|nr:MAG: TetR/AcrR family transcriptional regulator [Ignavibacteriales bacterium]